MVVTEMNPPKPRVKDSKKPKSKKLPNKTLKLVKHSHPSQENMFPQGFSFPSVDKMKSPHLIGIGCFSIGLSMESTLI